MEHRSVNITIGDNEIDVTPDSCEIFRFRQSHERMPKENLDYFHHWEETGVPDEYKHTIVFRQHKILVWMGGVATEEDIGLYEEAVDEFGCHFSDLSEGWMPTVHIVDSPSDAEADWYEELMMQDLNDTPPGGW